MDPRNIFNTENIARNYNKMDDEHASQNTLNMAANNGKVLIDKTVTQCKRCSWPHQWTLPECCCGCSIRTGCLFIGWAFMIGSSILIIGSVSLDLPMLYKWEDLFFTCLKFISSVILLVGVYEKRIRLLRISVFLSIIDIVVEIILAIVMAVQIGHFYPLMILFIGVPLALYFVVVINSYANQLVSGEHPTLPRMTV